GYTNNVWLSDVPTNNRNHEFTVTGSATGRSWPAPWAGVWPGDMAYDSGRGLMCQVNVGGDNGIYCWNPNTGAVVDSITGAFPWTGISQRGLAYRPDDDTFYIGGWNEGILYHVKGLSYPDKGAVISQCTPPDGNISGLAWNPAFNAIWAATNTPTDTIYRLDPATCAVAATLPHPSPGFAGGGLEMDEAGNLWMIDQSPNRVFLIESGVPSFVDVPWLSENPSSGTLAAGGSQTIQVSVDTTGKAPGIYHATLFIQTNSGRVPILTVPVTLIVPAYYQAVNAGDGAYVDLSGDTWSADQAYTAGSWGYTNSMSSIRTTKKGISGTNDDKLYQSQRQNPTEYRFDGLPNGVYEVDLRFAELTNVQPGSRLYDVIIEGSFSLPAHDTVGEVGTFAADQHVFFVPVTDGQLNIRFVGRAGNAPPVVNAIQVIHRPDH
ncbi:MAG: malectin domain-containing carbohydrate-binding protein, partial [Micromonosporaceae bacterium]